MIIILFSRCTEQGEERKYNYSIINNSGVTVEMIPYFSGEKDLKHKVILNNTDKINETYTDRPPYTAGQLTMPLTPFYDYKYYDVTRVEITFNNSKKMIHEGCTQANQCVIPARDIYNPIFSDERTETYIITPEDYQNAVDCGGNCN